jgi:hypothetical protein
MKRTTPIQPANIDIGSDPGLFSYSPKPIQPVILPTSKTTTGSASSTTPQPVQIIQNIYHINAPGGANGQVQINEGGSYVGDPGLTYNPSTDTLTTGTLYVTNLYPNNINFTSISNLTISGGSYNNVLKTDGAGALSWASAFPPDAGNSGKFLKSNGINQEWANVSYANLVGIPANIATTDYVGNAIANLVNSSPAALNTLNELANALGNDASFSTSITNSLANKASVISVTNLSNTVANITWANLSGAPNIDNYATTANLLTLSNTVANISWANLSGAPTIPTDIANLTDATGIIPTDVANLTDLTNLLSSGGGGTSYDQDLNTIDDVQFNSVTTGNIFNDGTIEITTPYGTTADIDIYTDWAGNGSSGGIDLWLKHGDGLYVKTHDGDHVWSFDDNGMLNLPAGGDIRDSTGNSVLGAGASTGNWEFRNDTIYNYAGGQINNSDTTHGATSGLVLPDNGNLGAVTTLFNNYGNVVLRSGEFVTTDNTIGGNGSEFFTDINIGGTFIDGWHQRNLQEIEINIFAAPAPIWSILVSASLGATVIVTYSTPSGNQTFTSVLSQQFTGQGQYDPNHDHGQRYTGRIDGTLPAGQTGIVTINFPTSSVTNKNWTFDNDGNLTLPTNTAKINYANGVSILDGISGGASTGNITFDGDNIGSTNDIVNIIGNNYAELQSHDNYIWVEETYAAIAVNDYEWTFHDDAVLTIANGANISQTTDNGGQKTFNITPPDTSDFEVVTVDGDIRLQTANSYGVGTTNTWTFDAAGNLTLPHSGVISEAPDTVTLSGTQTDGSMNVTYTRDKSNNNYYVLGGSNWNILYNSRSGTYGLTYIPQSLVYMQSTDLITWTLGPTTSLDIQTPSTGVIGVGSTKITSKDKTWSFKTDGNITLPTNTSKINYANGTSILSGLFNQDLNTSNNVTFNSVITNNVHASTGTNITIAGGLGTPIPSGIVFNGTTPGGGYMVVPSSSDWALGTVWTIEFRIKITGDSTGKIYRVIDQDPAGAGGTSIGVSISNGQLTILGTDQNPSYYPQPTINVWTHIAIVNNNTIQYVDVYYDGVLQTNHTGYGGPSNYQNTSALYIGKIGGSGDFQYLAGVLSGIRISKVARYIQNFTLPTEVLASDSDTLLLMNVLSGAEYDDSSSYARIISHTNTTLGSIPGIGSNPGNVVVTANSQSWIFNIDGNLTAPGNILMSNISGIYSSAAGYTVGLKMSNTEPSVKLLANNHEWMFDPNGVLRFPTPFSYTYPAITMAESANLLIQGYKASGLSENGGNIIVSGGSAGDSGNNGNATVFGQQVAIQTQLSTDLGSTIYNWAFDATGNLTLPTGGVITETNIPGGGLDGRTIALKPSGGTNSNQQLLVYPTGNSDYNHLHLTSGNLYSTELFLGNDNYYVKLANTGNIIINSNDNNGNVSQWRFNTDGSIYTIDELTLNVSDGIPTSLTKITSNQGWGIGSVGTNLATTGGSGTGLTVDVSDSGSAYSGITIHTAGTGYTDGDIITVSNGGMSDSFTISVPGTKPWVFDMTGNLTLPAGGDIKNSTGASQYISLSSLKTLVADSTDFADFQTRIAAL